MLLCKVQAIVLSEKGLNNVYLVQEEISDVLEDEKLVSLDQFHGASFLICHGFQEAVVG